jgi:hypothetical protein
VALSCRSPSLALKVALAGVDLPEQVRAARDAAAIVDGDSGAALEQSGDAHLILRAHRLRIWRTFAVFPDSWFAVIAAGCNHGGSAVAGYRTVAVSIAGRAVRLEDALAPVKASEPLPLVSHVLQFERAEVGGRVSVLCGRH